jgi:hypothetical protein
MKSKIKEIGKKNTFEIKPMKKAKLSKTTSMGGCGKGPEWQCGASAKIHS